MREILFRGKANSEIREGEWVYGSLLAESANTFPIIARDYDNDEDWISVIEWDTVEPQTVGQFTGLTDKNGKKIFEGDIVKAQDEIFGSPFCDGITGKIVYAESAYFIEPRNPIESQWLFNECAVYEVIGNIHDNPELLEEI